MTLFRKVFPNQSRPATADEHIDEEALRAALTENEAASHPLVLEPFEHNSGDPQEVEPRDEVDADDEAQHPVVNGEADEELEPDAETLVAPVDDEAVEEDASPIEAEYAQSDEEIAACLDRAMAADVSPVQQEAGMQDAETLDEGRDAESVGDALSNEKVSILTFSDGDAPEAENAPEAASLEPEEIDPGADGADDAVVAVPDAQDLAAVLQPQDTPSEDFMLEAQNPGAAPAPEARENAGPAVAEAAPLDLSQGVSLDAVPGPVTGRASRRAGRVKTRLLGFNRGAEDANDPFGQAPEATATAQRERFPVGWLVVVEGPGLGHAFSLFTGASVIGRGEDQVIRLDFGDTTISRQNHAAIAYDEEQNKFYLGHGGKSNIIRRNARPVLSTEELHHADLIRIGETTLRFVALCGSDFKWNGAEISDADTV